ncbi:MAG TPA: hypothetical protein VF857_05475, partial [Spirochaetota bacterium]
HIPYGSVAIYKHFNRGDTNYRAILLDGNRTNLPHHRQNGPNVRKGRFASYGFKTFSNIPHLGSMESPVDFSCYTVIHFFLLLHRKGTEN